MTNHDKLVHAITDYDRKEAGKRGYNPYALGIYLSRLEEVEADIARGMDPRAAIVNGYCGRLAAALLRALKLPAYTKADAMGGGLYYEKH